MGLKRGAQALPRPPPRGAGPPRPHRLGKIEARLHILDGLLIAYLNLDEVIRIVRYEDEPKAKLIESFELTELQADAILNTRLRRARLEEMEIAASTPSSPRSARHQSLLKSDEQQWKLVGEELKATREAYSKKTALGTPPLDLRRRARHRGRPRAGDDRARADHRHPVRAGLDPRRQGPRRGPLGAEVQGGRQAQLPGPGRDHRQAADLRLRRPLLHAGVRQAAGRPRPRRAAAPDDRPRRQGRPRRRLRAQAGAQALVVASAGLRLHPARGRGHRLAARASRC